LHILHSEGQTQGDGRLGRGFGKDPRLVVIQDTLALLITAESRLAATALLDVKLQSAAKIFQGWNIFRAYIQDFEAWAHEKQRNTDNNAN